MKWCLGNSTCDGNKICLSHCPRALKRHTNYGTSHQRKDVSVTCLQCQRFCTLSSWWKALQTACRHGAGDIAESSMILQGAGREIPGLAMGLWNLKAHPSDILPSIGPQLLMPLMYCHSLMTVYSNIYEHIGAIFIQTITGAQCKEGMDREG